MTIVELVERERARLSRLITASGIAAVLALGGLVLAGGVAVLGRARWIALPRGAPFAIWLIVLAMAALGALWTRRRLTRDASRRGLALAVEQEQSLRAGSLRGVLEVADTGALGRRGAEQLAQRLSASRASGLAPALHRRAVRRAGVALLAGLAGVLLVYSRSSAAPDGWRAMAHPVRAWTGTLLPRMTVMDLPHAVVRGERLVVSISAPDRSEITVSRRATGSAWRQSRHRVEQGMARVALGPMDADLSLFADDGRTTSDTASVRVVDRPFIGDVSVRAQFPAYLDRREETLPLGEPAKLPRGTVLLINGHSSTDLVAVHLDRPSDTLAFAITGRSFNGTLTAHETGRWTWSALGRGGPIADLPSPLEVEVVPDSAPRVEIMSPARDTLVAPSDSLSLSILATDDHGLAGVSLRITRTRQAGQPEPVVAQPLATELVTQWTGEAPLPLAKFGLQAGDELHVIAEAVDASPWKQSGASRELVLRVPGMQEQREAARAAGDSAVQRAEAAANAQKALQQKTSEAAKARDRRGADKTQESGSSKENSLSYEASEQAKALAREQRALADRVQQLQQQAKALEKQLKEAGALDSGLSSRLQEAQKLLKDALTPELMEQLRKLEESARKLSPDDARRAMGDLAEQQQKLREQLEKSVEMLKRAALEGAMQTLKDEAKDIAKQEKQLADSLGSGRKDSSASRDAQKDARDLANRSKDLARDVQDLQKRLERENAQTGAQQVAQAENTVKQSAQTMQNATRPPESAQPPKGEQQPGQQKPGQQQQTGQQQAGQQQTGQQQQAGQQQAGQQQGGQQQNGQKQSGEQQAGGKGGDQAQAARDAASQMEKASQQLADARKQQIDEWKKELTTELDQSIQEMLQLSREQGNLEQQARQGADKQQLQAQQSALSQGVDKAGQRLSSAGQKSTLLSGRSQQSVGDAKKKVEQATRELSQARESQQAASAMKEASEALNQAAASLVRDRERAQSASSASGFAEMLQQMQEMARQQGAVNSQAASLIPRPGQPMDQAARNAARDLARQQREVASSLEDVGDRDRTGKADEMAREARQLAQALEAGALDQSVIERQQRLFRRMLDAGRTLEQDKREDTGKREATAAKGDEVYTPQNATANGKAASRFPAPAWNDLRGLTPEERRLILDYFKRINAERP